jgi:hypothetical protein
MKTIKVELKKKSNKKNNKLKILGICLVVYYVFYVIISRPNYVVRANDIKGVEPVKFNTIETDVHEIQSFVGYDYQKLADFIGIISPYSPYADVRLLEYQITIAPTIEDGLLTVAISRKENGLGSYEPSRNKKNLWGIMCWNPTRYVCDWGSFEWEYPMKRVYDIDVTGKYYKIFDGSYESFIIGFKGIYCSPSDGGCETWETEVWDFYQEFKDILIVK